ncbi:MAG: Ig-like domain-containing protein [Pirellulales bacterium]
MQIIKQCKSRYAVSQPRRQRTVRNLITRPSLERLESRRLLAVTTVDDFYFVEQGTQLVAGPNVPVEVFPTGSTWDYLDQIGNTLAPDGVDDYPVDDEGDAWNDPDFDTATSTVGPWGSGPAILGAGIINLGPIQTLLEGVDGLGNTITTFLFRKDFELTDVHEIDQFTFDLLADDGAVIHINGVEVLRVNMPGGNLDTTTEAITSDLREEAYDRFVIDVDSLPAEPFQNGANTIAVEIHNDALLSSDIGFDMSMSVVRSRGAGVFGNDSGAAEAVLDSDVSSGTLELNSSGGFSYTPAPNFFGVDSFTYRATDVPFNLDLITAGSGPDGQTWNFLHPTNGADPDLVDPDFDATWYRNDGSYDGPNFSGSGKGLLGFGSFAYGPINTFIGEPPLGLRHTAYFTSTFELDVDPSTVTSLIADAFVDDGVFIYINGMRVGSFQMNGVADTYHTMADESANFADEDVTHLLDLDTSSLVQGTNFIAISLHQWTTNSSDLGFDLALSADVTPEFSDPATVTIVVSDTDVPPTAVDDAYTARANQPLNTLSAQLASVLANESPITEMGDASFAVAADDSVTDGTVVMDPVTGHFVFTPDPNFRGVTSFTYTVTDDDGTSPPATVTIDVVGELIADELEAVAPLGSLVYQGEIATHLDFAGHTHTIPLQLDAGQSLTLLASPQAAGLDVSIVLRDASSTIVATSDAGAAGQPELIQTFAPTAAGDYTVEVTSVAGAGNLDIRMILNAALEGEHHGGAANDSPGESHDLEDGFVELGSGAADRAAVLGTGTVLEDDWYSFSLDAGHSATLAAEVFGALDFDVETVVPLDHTWRYNRVDTFASGWHNNTYFVGGNWDSGRALLGVESDSVARPLRTRFGVDDPQYGEYTWDDLTYYFQTEFEFNGDPDAVSLKLRHIIDDGAVFYLNGQEVLRFNMPGGTITPNTLATVVPNNATLSGEAALPTEALVVGTNRLSVEVHQGVTNSSDIVFGAELKIETAVSPTLELYDGDSNLLATAVSADNVDFVIYDFVAPEAGTYYARVAGGNSDYSVLVTRGTAFDTEPNDDSDTQAQDISQGVGALGHVASDTDEGDSVRFAIFGEYGVTGSVPQAVADMVTDTDWNVDFIATTGNNNLGNRVTGAADWETRIGARYGEYILGRSDNLYPNQTSDVQRFFPTVGLEDFRFSEIRGYLDYFNTDPGSESGDRLPVGSGRGHNNAFSYYDFRRGPVHMFTVSPHAAFLAREVQMEWLESALRSSDAPWKFVYFNQAAFSSSSNQGDDAAMQWDFAEWGADAVFQGFDNTYERILNPTDNLLYFVTGLGGDAPDGFATPIDGSQVRYNESHGAMRVTVDAGTATFEFLSLDDGANGGNGGMVVDSYTLHNTPPMDVDHYEINLTAGELLTLETFTPAGGPFEFANSLDPGITLRDPSGEVVATDDNSAADGRNARVVDYAVLETGVYTVTVEAQEGTFGEYLLESSVGGDAETTVEGRHVFYNDSYFDGNDAAANADDDGAIDPSKAALLPGQLATSANYTGYTRGINGVMVDIAGAAKAIELSDFQFHDMGRDGVSETLAPAPDVFSVRPGEGVSGSDRVTFIWDTSGGAIFDTTWLRVTVGTSVGLATDDVFYFGTAPGEGSGGSDAAVAPADELGARNNGHAFGNPASVDDAWDYNKDRFVDPADQLFARNNQTGFLTRLQLFSAPAAAPLSGEPANTKPAGIPTAATLTGGESAWSELESENVGQLVPRNHRKAVAAERMWLEFDEPQDVSWADLPHASRGVDAALEEFSSWLDDDTWLEL